MQRNRVELIGPASAVANVERLFVYGTLAPGQPYEYVVGDIAGRWQPAVVRGRLLNEGWAARFGYPGIVIDEYGADIPGFLLTSVALLHHWGRLDKFEEAGYVRQVANVMLRDGTDVQANVYALRNRFR